MGYEFIKGSPYFTLSNYPFNNDNYEKIGSTTSRESLSINYYFTRAQLKELKEFISNENISKLVTEMNENYANSAADEY